MDSLTFIIPAYNDEATIETVVTKAVGVGTHLGVSFDILVINDASGDNTGGILSDLTKRIRNLSVITHTKNAGYGRTIKELYQKARNIWLFSVPGDYQIEPEEITKLWPYRNNADMIIGWRRRRREHPARRVQSHIYNMLLRLLFNLSLHDVNSVRLMKTSLMTSIRLKTSSAFVDAELAIRSQRAGFRIMEIPIEHRARTGVGANGGRITTIMPTIRDMLTYACNL